MRGSIQEAGHSHQCRLRMQDLINNTDYGRARIERAAERAENAASPVQGERQGGEGSAPAPLKRLAASGAGRGPANTTSTKPAR